MSDQNAEYAEEVFEDAQEDACPVDLHTSMQSAMLAVNLFFNNRFEEARAVMRPWAHKSMYHALGYGTFMFLQAIMTFDPKDIEVASETLKQSVEVCNKYRKRSSIGESLGKMVKKHDYSAYTEVEIHAELCYAETLLLRAVLSFIEDETLISFVKGGIKIRACYQSYKECWYMLESRKWPEGEDKRHFESGVRMGVGSFNLLISQLPNRVLKLLEFVGFSGNKSCQYLGLSELQKGWELKGSLRRVLCALILLGAHLMFAYVLGSADGDIELSKSILDDQLELYPNGALFLFFAGRLHYVKAEFTEAAVMYRRSWHSQDQWKQFHHVCYWELMWCAIMTTDWSSANHFASLLLDESRWSKASYAYIKACCMCMRQDTLSEQEKEDLRQTMRSIPGLKQRIAGKSLPFEKLAAKKSDRFFAQGERLTLAGLELIYAWNGYRILGKNYDCIDRMYVLAEEERKRLEDIPEQDQSEWHTDDLLLSYLLKGCSLSHMNLPLQAAECFSYVISNEKKIKDDKYLVPSALLEIGLLHLYGEKGDLEQAKTILEYAKNNYKGYSLESRLHFRIHGLLNKISAVQKGLETINSIHAIPPGGPVQGGHGTSAASLDPGVCEAKEDYPGISRSPSPFVGSPTEGGSASATFEDLQPQADLNVDSLCDLKIT